MTAGNTIALMFGGKIRDLACVIWIGHAEPLEYFLVFRDRHCLSFTLYRSWSHYMGLRLPYIAPLLPQSL
jgi:hypothetical protein